MSDSRRDKPEQLPTDLGWAHDGQRFIVGEKRVHTWCGTHYRITTEGKQKL